MEKDTTSFWAEIKKYEDALAKDPGSYCFAPLAELYRRIGLIDDAIVTAQKGTELHPEYVGGHLALGRAYADKGMRGEARESLERVVRFTPENLLAQKVLSQIYLEAGETALAKKALEVLLNANPNDAEIRITLESLTRDPEPATPIGEQAPDVQSLADLWPSDADGYLVELHPEDDIEELAELELLEEIQEPQVDVSLFQDTKRSHAAAFEASVEDEWDYDEGGEIAPSAGIRTATIAELYVSQGYLEQALDIYRDLVAADPHNEEYRTRLGELAIECEPSQSQDSVFPASGEGRGAFGEGIGRGEPLAECPMGGETEGIVPLPASDREVAGLEQWLENIRRVRECRSEKS